MRVLAIDVGEKKIGLAVGDTATGMAFSRAPVLVASWAEAWSKLLEVIVTENIEQVVIGWPLNSDGTVGPQAEQVQQFIDSLAMQVSVPIVRRDERNTSQAVQREQQQAGQKLQRGQEDSLAAQLILESYLSEQR